jgi:hypothetical protein
MDHYLIYRPLERTIDKDGNYTIKLSSNLTLKGTKEEIKLLITNLQRMIS